MGRQPLTQRPVNGPAIRLRRQARCLHIADLAQMVGCGPTTITRIELGYLHPSDGLLTRIATALAVDPETLYGTEAPTHCELVRATSKMSDEDAFCIWCPEQLPQGCPGACCPALDDFPLQGETYGSRIEPLCPRILFDACPCAHPATPERRAAHEAWLAEHRAKGTTWGKHDQVARRNRQRGNEGEMARENVRDT